MTQKPRKKPARKQPIHRAPPGTSPGTLIVDPNAPPSVIRITSYGPDHLSERQQKELRGIREEIGQQPVTWVDVEGLGNERLLREIGELFGLHPLALEDVVHVHQRAKMEEYADHVFLVARVPVLSDRLETEQLSLFLGKNFILTFQEHPESCLDPVRRRLREKRGRIRFSGADYLAYAILDAIVDSYFPILESFGERLETLEEQVLVRPDSALVARVHEVKHDLLVLRRAVWPLREAINALFPGTTPLVRADTYPYLRDCYDHAIRIIDLAENYREIASSLTDIYLSSVSNRMNEIMKVLTMIATIFIPLSFIAGVYGMNFENMPELKWPWGYTLSLVIMSTVAGGFLIYFWRKGWLGAAPDLEAATDPSPTFTPDKIQLGTTLDFDKKALPRDEQKG